MKWFGTKAAAQADARPVLARAWGSGAVALGEWPASYEAQLRSGVMGNPVAQRAMRLVSEGAGACAIKVRGIAEDARVRALVGRASAGQGLIETLAEVISLIIPRSTQIDDSDSADDDGADEKVGDKILAPAARKMVAEHDLDVSKISSNWPFWCSSMVISAPPINSPFTNNWGMVGQFECSLSLTRIIGSSRTFTSLKVTP